MISIKNLGIQLPQRSLLEDISFEVKSGEMSVLLGANGVGKSTLLKAIAGATQNANIVGHISYNGRALQTLSASELAEQRAVMSQQIQVLFPLSVLDLVQLGRVATGSKCSYQYNRSIAAEALAMVEMADFASRNAQTLSGGELQRVQFARVLAQVWPGTRKSPAALLLDEPTSNLDVNYQHFMLETVKKCCVEEGFAALAVLHDVNIAAQYADDLLVLKNKGLFRSGPPAQVLTAELMQKAFGVQAVVQMHPVLHCPQVMTYGTTSTVLIENTTL